MKYLPVSLNKIEERDIQTARACAEKRPEYIPIWQLSDDRDAALEKYARIEELRERLPGLDCGSCGAPSCRALAEDVVTGTASEEDCIFRMRERMRYMADGGDADEYLPPPFRRTEENDASE